MTDSAGLRRFTHGGPVIARGYASYSFVSPLMISLSNFRPSTAKATILPSLSPPNPVSTSLVDEPFCVETASAT